MTTARLQAIGSDHRARFGEDFDARLDTAVAAARFPATAASHTSERDLLIVLAYYAGAGSYVGDTSAPFTDGLDPDPDDPRWRAHRVPIQYGPASVDVLAFGGLAVAADQTIVATVTLDRLDLA
ncbi:MAG: hypothetical protein ACR2QO_18450 [Acidimicrobiales bacterium]